MRRPARRDHAVEQQQRRALLVVAGSEGVGAAAGGGLATASIYAITASGLTLTYATTGIFNWSHGAIGMLAAFAYWQMHIGWGWPTLVSFAVCLLVLAPLLGVVLAASAASASSALGGRSAAGGAACGS